MKKSDTNSFKSKKNLVGKKHINTKHGHKTSFNKKVGKIKKSIMKPGSDRSLKQVFKQIGVPGKTEFKPDQFQLKAIKAIETSDCLVTAPTGAGKTWIAQEVAKKTMQNSGKVWYATPLKALTNSIHAQFSELFEKENVGILTGDIKENADASIVIGTTEILRNQLYDAMHTGDDLDCDLIILDEAHFLGDKQRGVVWEEIMIYMPVRISLLMLSATIGNPFSIAQWLENIRGKSCKVVENHDRPVPLFPLFLHPSGTLFPLMAKQKTPDDQNDPNNLNDQDHQNTLNTSTIQILHKKVLKFNDLKKQHRTAHRGKLPQFAQIMEILDNYNLLPAIFFLKSRKECDHAIKLCSSDLLSKNPTKRKALKNKIDELVSNNPHLANHNQRLDLEQTGCASHHSGHLPAWKIVVETLMSQGFLHAMFATSTVAAGVNFPARSVVVLNSDRFNGVEFAALSPSEFQQMTGRAGRRGMDKIGFAIMLPGRFMDLKYVAKLINSPSVDIESQIHINFSMVLNLLLSHDPYQIKLLLKKSFASHLILSGKKKGKKAREKFGSDLELLWSDFLDHMDFLIEQNFVTKEGILTSDGLWASNLRVDSPLLIAQSIRKNFLPERDPALLAAVIASFVNEKEFSDDIIYTKALPKHLKEVFLNTRKGLKPFAVEMLKSGFHAPNLFIQPSLLIYSWAHDEEWDNIVNTPEYGPGDFARLALRTADNLRQLSKLKETFPVIAKTAKEAMSLLLKEPVVISDSI